MRSIDEIKNETEDELKEPKKEITDDFYGMNEEYYPEIAELNNFSVEEIKNEIEVDMEENEEPTKKKEKSVKTKIQQKIDPIKTVKKDNGIKCIYCRKTKNREEMTVIQADPVKLECWKSMNDIVAEPDELLWICKSHFQWKDFKSTGLLKYNAVFTLKSLKLEPVIVEQIVPMKNCVYCRKMKSRVEMINIEMKKEQLEQWNIDLHEEAIDGQVIKNLWICKSHFHPSDVPMVGERAWFEDPDVRSCVYCHSKRMEHNLVKIVARGKLLESWKVLVDLDIDTAQLIDNPWICKSHFERRDGKRDLIPVLPNDASIFQATSTAVCVYCHLEKPGAYLTKIHGSLQNLAYWKTARNVAIGSSEITKSPYICKSHFKPDDFTKQGILKTNAVPFDDNPSIPTAVCVYCHLEKPDTYLTKIFGSMRNLVYWKRAKGVAIGSTEITRNPYICKSHFKPEDFTKQGTLKTVAVPFDGIPNIVERECVYCGCMTTSLDVAKIVMDEEPFEDWKLAYGFRFNYNETLANPWICKSHFNLHDTLTNGNLKPHAAPLGLKQANVRLLCVYCHWTNMIKDMAVIDFESNQLEKWRKAAGIMMNMDDIVKNPFICKSHFNTDDIKFNGCLKPNSLPIDNASGELATRKCVCCNMITSCSEMARIRMAKRNLTFWRNMIGIDAEVEDIMKNPWICKSHLKGVLKPDAVPVDGGMRFSSMRAATAAMDQCIMDCSEMLENDLKKKDCLLEPKQQVLLEDEEKPPIVPNDPTLHDHTYAKLC